MTVLILDNYDSFSYNLFQHLAALGVDPVVVRNDETDIAGIRKLAPSDLGPHIPILGVC